MEIVREHFFEALNKLKKSDVIIDNETVELIQYLADYSNKNS
ncbi:MAG: hypothetical protein ACLRZ6_06270 [Lachnospiraceae bacterium]